MSDFSEWREDNSCLSLEFDLGEAENSKFEISNLDRMQQIPDSTTDTIQG